jgi:hypothetical protein
MTVSLRVIRQLRRRSALILKLIMVSLLLYFVFIRFVWYPPFYSYPHSIFFVFTFSRFIFLSSFFFFVYASDFDCQWFIIAFFRQFFFCFLLFYSFLRFFLFQKMLCPACYFYSIFPIAEYCRSFFFFLSETKTIERYAFFCIIFSFIKCWDIQMSRLNTQAQTGETFHKIVYS